MGGGDSGGGGGGDGGGGSGGVSHGAAVFEGGGPSGGSPPPSGGGDGVATAKPASGHVDARELAQEFGQVIGQHFRPPEPPQRQVTAEEAKRLLNVWDPTPEWLAKYDNLENRLPAIAEMRDGFIKHADTIAQYRINEAMQRMQQSVAPVVQFMQQQEAKAGEWRFQQKYPDLGHENMRPLLFAVSQNILAQGIPFRSEGELFDAIAHGVERVIQVSNPEFKLGNGSGNPGLQKQQGQRPAPGGIPVMTSGSGGGGMGRGGAGPPKPRGLAVFD